MADFSSNTFTFVLCVSGALSGAMSYCFYRLFKNRSQTAQQVRHIVVWHPDAKLANYLDKQSSHYLAYAAVEGVVKELGRSLRSNYGEEEGVIKRSQVVEYKTRFENGFWVDVRKVLQDSLETVPFAIVTQHTGGSKHGIEVIKPHNAMQLHDELDTTFDQFEPTKNWMLRLTGEISKGIHSTEHMLLTGTKILGIGKVFLEQGQIKLGPPDESERFYILTRMRLKELVIFYEAQSTNYKMIAAISACVGTSLLIFAIYRFMVIRFEQNQQRLQFEEIRRSLGQHRRLSHNVDEEQTEEVPEIRHEDACVVCLSNIRQIITIPCGHFAICADCAEILPNPKMCPVCRAYIDKFIPVYRP